MFDSAFYNGINLAVNSRPLDEQQMMHDGRTEKDNQLMATTGRMKPLMTDSIRHETLNICDKNKSKYGLYVNQ